MRISAVTAVSVYFLSIALAAPVPSGDGLAEDVTGLMKQTEANAEAAEKALENTPRRSPGGEVRYQDIRGARQVAKSLPEDPMAVIKKLYRNRGLLQKPIILEKLKGFATNTDMETDPEVQNAAKELLDEVAIGKVKALGAGVDPAQLERVKAGTTKEHLRTEAQKALDMHTISTLSNSKSPYDRNRKAVEELAKPGGELREKAAAALDSHSIKVLGVLKDDAETKHMDRVAKVLEAPNSPETKAARDAAHDAMLDLSPKNKYRKAYEKQLIDPKSDA
ncbi:hypothetical protein FRB96_005396 [Tulasnella sp. 330]|nr:hypothetical protein FRB96_005396 [Tulasnella sp. 330]KAG8883013.1 hypothetical protein FRB97_007387 [Tulasnella sp. 331]